MTRFLISLMVLITCMFTTVACSGEKIFTDIPSGNGITKVYVNKTMLSMAQHATKTYITSGIPADAIKSLSGVEIISCDNKTMTGKIAKDCLAAVEKLNLEPVTEIESDDSNITIYMQPDSTNPSMTNRIVLLINDSSDFTAIAVSGKIDIEQLIASQSQSNKQAQSDK